MSSPPLGGPGGEEADKQPTLPQSTTAPPHLLLGNRWGRPPQVGAFPTQSQVGGGQLLNVVLQQTNWHRMVSRPLFYATFVSLKGA